MWIKNTGAAQAKEAVLPYLRDQLRCNVTANGVRNRVHYAEFLNRVIVIYREHVRDTERAGTIQIFPANTCNHLCAYLLRGTVPNAPVIRTPCLFFTFVAPRPNCPPLRAITPTAAASARSTPSGR